MNPNATFSQIVRIITEELGITKVKLEGLLDGSFRLRIALTERDVHNVVTQHGWSPQRVQRNVRLIFINPKYDSVHLAVSNAQGGTAIEICRNDDENETPSNFVARARLALHNVLPNYKIHNQNPLRQYLQIKDKPRHFVTNKLYEEGWSIIEQRGSTTLWSHPNHTDITMFLEYDGCLWLTATHQSVDGCAGPSTNKNESVVILTEIFGGNIFRRTTTERTIRTAAPDEALVNINIDSNWLDFVRKAGWYLHGISTSGDMYFFNGEEHPGYVLRTFSMDGFTPEANHKEGVEYIGIQVKPMTRLRDGEITADFFANNAIKVLRTFFPGREIRVRSSHNIVVNVESYLLGELATILERQDWVKTSQTSDAESEEFSYQNLNHPGLLITIGTARSADVSEPFDSAFMHITPSHDVVAPRDKISDNEVCAQTERSEEVFPEADIDEAEKRNLDRVVLEIQRRVSKEEAPYRKGRKVLFARGTAMHEALERVEEAMFSCDPDSEGLIQDMKRTTKKRVAYIGTLEGVKFSLREKKSGKIVLKARGTSKYVLAK